MGSEPSPWDASLDGALAHGDDALRQSHEVLRSLNQIIGSQREVLVAADGTLNRTDELLQQVDIDLAALERSPFAGADDDEPLRVLIVDDSEPIRRVLEIMFTAEFGDDVDVRAASGGKAALDEIGPGWVPGLVVLDWQMPDLDGLETARRLRPLLPECRIVMYSSRSAADGEEAARAAGADAYLEKGADTAGLLAAVEAAVEWRRSATAP